MEISDKEVDRVLDIYTKTFSEFVSPDKEEANVYIKGVLAGAKGLAEIIKLYMELH